MVLLSAASSDRSSKEEREAFHKGGVLPDNALSALQHLQQHPLPDKPLPPLPPPPPQPPIQQPLTFKDRERPSTQVLEGISSMRTDATPNMQAMLEGSPRRSSSGTHTQGPMFRRLRSSASSMDQPQQQQQQQQQQQHLQSEGNPYPSRTNSHASCPSNLIHTSMTTPTLSTPQAPLESTSTKQPLNSQARPPPSRSTGNLLPHQAHIPPPEHGPISAPTVPQLDASISPSMVPRSPLAALRGKAGDAQGPGPPSKESMGRARRLPKILVPPAALGLSTHPSLCGSTPEWQPDFGSADVSEDQEGQQADAAAHGSNLAKMPTTLWEPPSQDEIQHCVKHTLEAHQASRSASQLLLGNPPNSPPSPNSCRPSHPTLNTSSMGVQPSAAPSRDNTHPLAVLSGDALPLPLQGDDRDCLAALPFPEDGNDASQYLKQGSQEAANLNPSVRSGLSRAARAQTQQQQQQQQQQQEDSGASMTSPATASEAASSSQTRTTRMGLDIRRSGRASNQLPNSLHRLRHSAWSLGLAALAPKKGSKGGAHGGTEGTKGGVPSPSGSVCHKRVASEPSSSSNGNGGGAAKSDAAGHEHAGLAAAGSAQGEVGGSNDVSVFNSPSSQGENHTSGRQHSTRVGSPQNREQAPECSDMHCGVGQSHSRLQQQHSQQNGGVERICSMRVRSGLEQRKQQHRGLGVDGHGVGQGADAVEVLYPMCPLADSSSQGSRSRDASSESDIDSGSVMGESMEGSGSHLWRAAGRAWLDGFSGCLGNAISPPKALPPSPTTHLHSLGKAGAVANPSTDVANPLSTASLYPVNLKASNTDTAYKGEGRVGRCSEEQQQPHFCTLNDTQPAANNRSNHHQRNTSNTSDANKRTRAVMQLPGQCDGGEESQHLFRYLDRAARCSSFLNDPTSEAPGQASILGTHHHHHHSNQGQKKGNRQKEGLLSRLGQSLRRNTRIKPTHA